MLFITCKEHWKGQHNGKGYGKAGDQGRSHLHGKVHGIVKKLAPRIAEVEEDFAGRYSWTINGEINSI